MAATLPPVGPATYRLLNRMGQDAGNLSMRKAGRRQWSEDDARVAQERFEQLVALYREPGEAPEETHARLQEAARATWFEGTGPDADGARGNFS